MKETLQIAELKVAQTQAQAKMYYATVQSTINLYSLHSRTGLSN